MSLFSVTAQPERRQSCIEQEHHLSSISFYDATTSNRIGFRGAQVAAFLEAHGILIPEQPNRALKTSNGLWILRLGHTEFWLVDKKDQNTDAMIELEKEADQREQVTRLYCQHSHALFVLTGDDCPEMFAKVCAVDLSGVTFKRGCIAQTSVARVSSVVVNVSKSEFEQTRFLIMSDISSADYLWKALDDAAEEFQQTTTTIS
ncbi:hypothetical protein [Grimontia marina]|uniref:Sarcosine oxidase, gamma subunit family n=1 Tax=Grimontia marina TaxID=646534 RepID=A0A128FGW8_9GAMM|nr:hypothetical protein [Grimontia marina]CZF86038.1 Sarcosine oxidase, gamma subunit family [Grimontia marina]